MLTKAKATLTGSLTVTTKYCDCCKKTELLNLLDDEGSPIYYCSACFPTNCSCGGSKIITIEK